LGLNYFGRKQTEIASEEEHGESVSENAAMLS